MIYVYLHLNLCGGFRKIHLLWNEVHNGRSRSSKVVDFGTNRKRVCDVLPISDLQQTGSYLALFFEIWRLKGRKSLSVPPLSFTTRAWGESFRIFPWTSKLRIEFWAIRWCKFCDPTLRRFDAIQARDRRTNGRTDRRTDKPIVATTALA